MLKFSLSWYHSKFRKESFSTDRLGYIAMWEFEEVIKSSTVSSLRTNKELKNKIFNIFAKFLRTLFSHFNIFQ